MISKIEAYPVWAQKNQSGAEALFNVKLHSGISVAEALTGKKPESTPLEVHGAAKVDCVTVCSHDWVNPLPSTRQSVHIRGSSLYWKNIYQTTLKKSW